jgi:hypothetical protein
VECCNQNITCQHEKTKYTSGKRLRFLNLVYQLCLNDSKNFVFKRMPSSGWWQVWVYKSKFRSNVSLPSSG